MYIEAHIRNSLAVGRWRVKLSALTLEGERPLVETITDASGSVAIEHDPHPGMLQLSVIAQDGRVVGRSQVFVARERRASTIELVLDEATAFDRMAAAIEAVSQGADEAPRNVDDPQVAALLAERLGMPEPEVADALTAYRASDDPAERANTFTSLRRHELLSSDGLGVTAPTSGDRKNGLKRALAARRKAPRVTGSREFKQFRNEDLLAGLADEESVKRALVQLASMVGEAIPERKDLRKALHNERVATPADLLAFADRLTGEARSQRRKRSDRPAPKRGDTAKSRAHARLTDAELKAALAKEGGGGRRANAASLAEAVASRRAELDRLHPSQGFVARLRDGEAAAKLGIDHNRIAALLERHGDLDLATANLPHFFRKHGLERESDLPARAELMRAQRLLRLAGDPHAAQALAERNLGSARSVARLSQPLFVRKMAEADIPADEASAIHARAEAIHDRSVALAGEMRALGGGGYDGAVAALSGESAAAFATSFPDLATLFGSGDSCTCGWCRKLGSPAAYLVDMLDFVGARTAVDDSGSLVDPKSLLLGLRPDIALIDLDCPNTEVEFPHVDLVNELLGDMIAPEATVTFGGPVAAGAPSAALVAAIEGAGWPISSAAKVHPPASPADPIWALRDPDGVYHITPAGGGAFSISRTRQTLKSAAELRAQPAYPNPAVDPVLEAATIGFVLPYSPRAASARALLKQAGSSRLALMQALRRDGTQPPSDIAAAAEQLGLDDEQRALVTTAGAAGRQRAVFGTGASNAAVALRNVAKFLEAAGIDYATLQALLRTRYINPRDSAPVVRIRHLDAGCDTARKELDGLAESANGTLDRMQRLLRLWRKSGWRLVDLDAAIAAPRIGNGTLNDGALVRIAALGRLADATGAPIERVIPIYGLLDDVGEDGTLGTSLYARLFLAPDSKGAIVPAFTSDAIRANEGLAVGDPARLQFTDRRDEIAFALGVRAADVDELAARAAARLGPDGNAITRRGLAELAAYPLFARAIGLSLDELLELVDLSAIDPVAEPARALALIAVASLLSANGLTAADALFYIADTADDLELRRITDESIAAALSALAARYLVIETDNISAFDDSADLSANLAALDAAAGALPVAVNEEMKALAAGQAAVGGVAASTVLADFVVAQLTDPALGALPAAAGLEALRATLEAAVAAAGGDMAAAPVKTAQEAFVKAVLDALAADRRRRARKDAAVQALADTFEIDDAMARALAGTRLKATLGTGADARLLVQLTALPLVDSSVAPPAAVDPTEAVVPRGYEILRLADKLVGFVRSLSLEPSELTAIAELTPAGWLVPDAMKVGPVGAPQSFAALERLLQGLVLQRSRPAAQQPAPAPPADYWAVRSLAAAGPPVDDLLALFAGWTGLDLDTLKALDLWFGFSAGGVATSYADPQAFVRLDLAASQLRLLRIDLVVATELTAPAPAPTALAALTAALRTSYDDATWLGVLGSINDPLRAALRDSMVAYLIGTRPEFSSADDIYDALLIDPQMQPCRDTSRIVAAHSSVQMFVERCRMGVQPGCRADEIIDPKWSQWEWMRRYRVYEAAMTIFCHPHNYLEPDLRDDVSPFFEDMLTELLQGELEDDMVETVTANYLERLDGVARLEVIASHYQGGDIQATHVLARTQGGDPALFYHRKFVAEREWTPWTKVDLEISSDVAILFSRRGRLSVAWLVFSEEADREQDQTVPNSSPGTTVAKGRRRWRLHLAVSDHDGRKWAPRRVSREYIATSWTAGPLPAKDGFRLTTASPSQLEAVLSASTPAEFLERAKNPDTDMVLVSYDFGAGHEGLDDEADYVSEAQIGGFSLSGCSGVPEPFQDSSDNLAYFPLFKDSAVRDMRFRERGLDSPNDLAIMAPPYSIGSYQAILNNTPDQPLRPLSRFRIAWPMQMSLIDILTAIIMGAALGGYFGKDNYRRFYLMPLGTFMPFFFQDGERSYVVVPGLYKREEGREGTWSGFTYSEIDALVTETMTLLVMFLALMESTPPEDRAAAAADFVAEKRFQDWAAKILWLRGSRFALRFRNFYHPHVCALRTALSRGGVPGLVNRETQDRVTSFDFAAPVEYDPAPIVLPDYPAENIDFDRDGAYAGYNWELFLHLPWLIAVKLSRAGRFEDARRWFHLIFDPTGANNDPEPARYWVTRPFREMSAADYAAQRIESIIYESAAHPGGVGVDEVISDAIAIWRGEPFSPFAIARTRPVAFQRAVVRHYMENLIALADREFRAYTREQVDFAEQIYTLVRRLAGPKPTEIPPAAEPVPMCFAQLDALTDLLGNAMIGLENLVPTEPMAGAGSVTLGASLGMPYFCTPADPHAGRVHDLVEGRLFNIRHCRNIDGIEVPLALFAPPIDPMALVRAAAAGLSIGEILAGFGAPLPAYRFQTQISTARGFATEVRTLSGALLQALEKGDVERIAVLRNRHEEALAKAVIKVKQAAIEEAQAQIDVLDAQKRTAEARRDFFRNRAFMTPAEIAALALNVLALIPNAAASALNFGAAAIHAGPNVQIGASGFGGSPHASVVWGSSNMASMMSSLASGLGGVGGLLSSAAGIANTLAGYERRKEDWDHNAAQEDLRLAEIAKQRVGAEIRLEMSQADLASAELQADQAKQLGEIMTGKFSNAALYDWMVGRLASVHYKAFQLAQDLAKRAERCYRVELGVDESIIQSGYWDSLHKGLLAGDLLLQDINALEAAYLAKNVRTREVTKTVSLGLVDPMALETLRSTGSCRFSVPEALFDMDHPGHYFRRIKSVSVTVPCVAGPYASVAARLTLTGDRYRKSTAEKPGAQPWQRYAAQPDDDRFVSGAGGIQSIATSTAQNDSGLFELRLGDERYLPFEHAGAESDWLLEFNAATPGFDFTTMTDVVLTMRCTAREGSGTFRSLVENSLAHQLETMALAVARDGLLVAIDLRRDLPFEWNRLKNSGSASLQFDAEKLPWLAQSLGATISETALMARMEGNPASLPLTIGGAPVTLNAPGGAPYLESAFSSAFAPALGVPGEIAIASAAARDALSDLIVIARLELP